MKRYVKSATQEKALTEGGRTRLFGEDPQGEVVIPDGYTRIDNFAFEGCTNLTSIVIPGSVTTIGSYAFSDCTGLTSVKMENSVEYIGYRAFDNCTSLTSVKIPDHTELGEGVFEGTPLEGQYKANEVESEELHQLTDYSKMMTELEVDLDSGIYDPLYEDTAAGSYITGLCQDVESGLGVWLEPSIQGGTGGIWVYSSDDDHCLAENIDFEGFDERVIDIALDSNSEEEFKSSYRAFLENTIEQHAYVEEY